MLKQAAAALLGAALLIGTCGCSFSDLGRDDMLRPPKTMGDEAEIEQLIASSAHGGYTLKYPKNGGNRSAIVMHDLDGDGTDESIAFFRDKDGSTGIHMLVMYEKKASEPERGEWKISADFVTETPDVDCVDFADVDGNGTQEILAGYATYTPGVNSLSVYTYSEGDTQTIDSGQNYSAFYTGSADAEGKSRVFTLSLFSTENEAKATLLEFDSQRKALFARASCAMDGNVVSYRSVTFADLGDNVKGLLVDGVLVNGDMNTQILYYDSLQDALLNPLNHEPDQNPTQRSSEVVCTDVGQDMKIEIPTVSSLPFNGKSGATSAAELLTWNHFDVKTQSLLPVSRNAANYHYGYTVRLPDAWTNGSFTALLNETGSQLSFCEWSEDMPGTRLFDITVFKVSDWDQGKETDGYTLIYKDNRYAYTFINYRSNSALALDDNTIKTAFTLLGRSTAANGKS